MSIDIEAVKKAIGIPEFTRTDLLEITLTHPSYINENQHLIRQPERQKREYRRLAILGDAMFNAVVVDYLYQRFTNFNQGSITQWKNYIVSRKQAYQFANILKLRHLCDLGKGEKCKHETQQQDLLGEMFEALLGAIFIEFERDFYEFSHWLVKHLLANIFNYVDNKSY